MGIRVEQLDADGDRISVEVIVDERVPLIADILHRSTNGTDADVVSDVTIHNTDGTSFRYTRNTTGRSHR